MLKIRVAVSYDITRPEYTTHITEYNLTTTIEGPPSSRYRGGYEDVVAFSSEIGFIGKVIHLDVRRVASVIINMVGTDRVLRNMIDSTFMGEVRHVDHDVVDVTNFNIQKAEQHVLQRLLEELPMLILEIELNRFHALAIYDNVEGKGNRPKRFVQEVIMRLQEQIEYGICKYGNAERP
jgi:hypothetical protein